MNDIFVKEPNSFGYSRYSPLIVFADKYKILKAKIKKDLETHLFPSEAGYFEKIEDVINSELKKLNGFNQLVNVEITIEKKLNAVFKQDENLQSKIKERCTRIFEQIQFSVADLQLNIDKKHNVLDIGAGSGLVTKMVKEHYNLNAALLVDVLDYRHQDVKNSEEINFRLFAPPFTSLEIKDTFQVCIITNTLHHCNSPKTVFETALNYLEKGGLVFIIESCIGIDKKMVLENKHSLAVPYQTIYTKDGSFKEEMLEYFELSIEEQMIYGSFFDWLYNRVFVNGDINVPFNFAKPEDWNVYFKNKGLTVLKTYLMGFDQPAVLEFHTLHVLIKN